MKPFKALIIPQSEGEPSHPIVLPPIDGEGPPLVIWGPNDPRPDHPIVIPPNPDGGVPTHPIVIPPEIWGPTDPRPDQGLPGDQPEVGRPEFPTNPIAPGGQPPGTWGPNDPRPSQPIYIPEPPEAGEGDKALVLVVSRETGPVWFVIDKNDGLKPTHPQPKPGAKRK